MTTSQSEDLKKEGNAAFSSGKFSEALELFSKAIEIDPENHVLYSNRSAAHASLKDYSQALEDSEKAISIKPDWSKGYSRKGAALYGMSRLEEAKLAYEKGLEIDGSNTLLKKGLEDTKKAMENAEKSASQNPFAKMFDGDIFGKLAGHPELAKHLSDPSFVQKLTEIQKNPQAISQYLNDPLMMQVMGALLGINITTPEAFAAENPEVPDTKKDTDMQVDDSQEDKQKEYEQPPTAEEAEIDESKKLAMDAKTLGDGMYKQKKFDDAIKHYEEALSHDSSNVSIRNNMGAVYLELGKYDEAIECCEKAVEVGRENRADYKHIARALGRIGTAYLKKDNLESAIKYFQKSLSEYRTADILNKLRDTEKLKQKKDREAYQDPIKSDEARSRGNELFKAGKYADAVSHYTEAIKRSETDPRAYSNRAACYTKLMALPEGLKDCEKAIELDKTFVKAYIRKAAIQMLMKEYTKCIKTCDEALDVDKAHNGGKSSSELNAQKQKAQMAMYGFGDQDTSNMSQEERAQKAMQNPEIQKILSDPVMRQILEQMSSNPSAAQEHMKNPDIREKIQILMAAGVLSVR